MFDFISFDNILDFFENGKNRLLRALEGIEHTHGL